MKKKTEINTASDGSIDIIRNHSFRPPFFLDNSKGYFISNFKCETCSHMPDGINVYSINNVSVALLDQLNSGYYGLQIGFASDYKGWVLVDSYNGDNPTKNTYVFKTVDGGNYWGYPILVAKDQMLDELVVVSENKLIIHSI